MFRSTILASSLLDEMFVFLPAPGVVAGFDDIDSTLDVGEVSELEFAYRAIGVGEATFRAHVHAVILAEDLFPRGRGDDGSKAVAVRS